MAGDMKHSSALMLVLPAVCLGLVAGCGENDTAVVEPPVEEPIVVTPTNPPPDFTVGHNGPEGTMAGYPVLLAPMLGRTIVNEAIDGSDTGDGKGIVSRVLRDHKPAYLLILYGANDVISGMRRTNSVANLRAMRPVVGIIREPVRSEPDRQKRRARGTKSSGDD